MTWDTKFFITTQHEFSFKTLARAETVLNICRMKWRWGTTAVLWEVMRHEEPLMGGKNKFPSFLSHCFLLNENKPDRRALLTYTGDVPVHPATECESLWHTKATQKVHFIFSTERHSEDLHTWRLACTRAAVLHTTRLPSLSGVNVCVCLPSRSQSTRSDFVTRPKNIQER